MVGPSKACFEGPNKRSALGAGIAGLFLHSPILDVTVLGDTISFLCRLDQDLLLIFKYFNYFLAFYYSMYYYSITALRSNFLEIVMILNSEDKSLILSSLDTEMARIKRAINSSPNQAIKEVYSKGLADLQALSGRVFNEPVKESK